MSATMEVTLARGSKYTCGGKAYLKGRIYSVDEERGQYLMDTGFFDDAAHLRSQQRAAAERAARVAARSREAGDEVEEAELSDVRLPSFAVRGGKPQAPKPAGRKLAVGPRARAKAAAVTPLLDTGEAVAAAPKVSQAVTLVLDPEDPYFDAVKVKAAVEAGIVDAAEVEHLDLFGAQDADAGQELDEEPEEVAVEI